MRSETTSQLDMTLSAKNVRKRKKTGKNAVCPLDYENGWTIDVLVVSGAYVSAYATRQNWTVSNNKPPKNLWKRYPLKLQIQLANGQLKNTVNNNNTEIWYWGSYNCRTLCPNEEFDKANHRFALHETQQAIH